MKFFRANGFDAIAPAPFTALYLWRMSIRVCRSSMQREQCFRGVHFYLDRFVETYSFYRNSGRLPAAPLPVQRTAARDWLQVHRSLALGYLVELICREMPECLVRSAGPAHIN